MKKLLVLFSCLCLLSGCGLIFHSRQVNFIPQTKDADVFLSGTGTFYSDEYKKAGTGSCTYRLNNFKELYMVKQTKNGYKTSMFPIEKTKFNKVRLADLMFPLAGDIVFVASAISGSTGVVAPALVCGTVGWASVVGPWQTYPKKVMLPVLLKYPERNTSDHYLYIDEVSVDVRGEDYKNFSYDDLKKYAEGDYLYSSKSKEDLKFASSFLADTISAFLGVFNFTDSTSSLFKDPLKYTELQCSITKINVVSAGHFIMAEVGSSFSLNDPITDKMLSQKYIESASDFAVYQNGDKQQTTRLIADALQNGTIRFLSDSLVIEQFQKTQSPFLAQYESWDTLKCKVSNDTVKNMSDAVKSVVTVKVKNGHGSGCIISEDSYIITNYHVIEDTVSEVKVILEDGTSYPAKVVRVNPLYDLALLKTQPLKIKPFIIDSDNSISVGSEVYSIGTPTDIELGQTVTKGIISGKRSFGKHVLIQTDVSINKGNSGGALIDTSGKLIGITSSKIIGVGIEGIGFAIPGSCIRDALKIQ